jgi:Gpi18-like mannosyltransferase
MKKFFKQNKQQAVFILGLIIVWRVFLFLPYFLGQLFLPQRTGYIGPTVWANFDGVHYLSIAQNGYFQYEQAFFPLFPMLIKYFAFVTGGNYVIAGIFIVHIALFIWLFLLYKLFQLDFTDGVVQWTLIFYIFFPSGFFFGSVYTETLFLCLTVGAFYAARKENWLLAGVLTGLASATKLIGIFLLPALLYEFYYTYKKQTFSLRHLRNLLGLGVLSISGLCSYMTYLWYAYKDPLFFIHAQPAFGANRTGGTIILLPQVLYRYIKIFMTVSFSNYDTWIALLEFIGLVVFLVLICYGIYQRKIHLSYFIFAILAIIGPTLTGSLSSMPRYTLVVFPVFILFGLLKNKSIKVMLLLVFILLLTILTVYFTRGYFIA